MVIVQLSPYPNAANVIAKREMQASEYLQNVSFEMKTSTLALVGAESLCLSPFFTRLQTFYDLLVQV